MTKYIREHDQMGWKISPILAMQNNNISFPSGLAMRYLLRRNYHLKRKVNCIHTFWIQHILCFDKEMVNKVYTTNKFFVLGSVSLQQFHFVTNLSANESTTFKWKLCCHWQEDLRPHPIVFHSLSARQDNGISIKYMKSRLTECAVELWQGDISILIVVINVEEIH